MAFLESLGLSPEATPQDLHAVIKARNSPQADQWIAERQHALEIAPHNRYMRDPLTFLGARIADAMTHLDGELAITPVPIVRCRSLRFDSTHEHDRNDKSPLARTSVIENCVQCGVSAGAALVPFWVAFGQYIVQVDLCGSCAEIAIFEHGAVLQVATPGTRHE